MAMNPSPDAAAPRMVGRYELTARVVAGTLGDLWRARIASGPDAGRVVLVRRIPRGGALDQGAVERITNAGFAAMELRHPKIAAVLDVVVADAEIAVVSEHIGGAVVHSLGRPASGKRPNVSVAVALRLAVDMLEALEAVREPWLELFADADSEEEKLLATGVHGGLVPDGILIASFGETMLVESGLAGVLLTVPAIADNPDVIAFRAPEQLEAKRPLDARADLFSIGALLWELIAGRALFGPAFMPKPTTTPKLKGADALQTSAVRRKVLNAPVQRLDTLPLLKGKVGKPLADFVARCLERDPAARFPDVKSALEALTALGPEAVAPHDAVAKLIAAAGILETAPEEEPPPSGLASNRPTVPPVEDGAASDPDTEKSSPGPDRLTQPGTAASVGIARVPVERPPVEDVPTPEVPSTEPQLHPPPARESLPPELAGADIESLPPTSGELMGADVESLPPTSVQPMGADVESLPPVSTEVSPVDVQSLSPPSADLGADVESIPPSDHPAPAREVRAPSMGEGSITMLSEYPPGIDAATLPPLEEEPPEFPVSVPGAFPSPSARKPSSPDVVAGAVRSEETTSAPVVRPLDLIAPRGESADATPDAVRREKSRKIVVYVMAAAVVLVVLGLLRALLSKGGDDAAQAPAAPTSTVEKSVAAGTPPTAAPAPPAPVAEPATAPAAVAPTSTPTAQKPAALEGEAAARKPVPAPPRKKPYRPTGI